MKKIYLFLIVGITALLITVSSPADIHSNISGAPAGRTGSPSDGATCNASGCHSGSPVVENNSIISSDVPSTGYVPGETYTFDVTISQPSINRYGFEISPQSSSGALLGTMVVTNSTNTKLISSGKYITHKQAGTAGTNNSKTWSFDWIAPADLGLTEVTFYGALNAANANNSATGDRIFTTQYTVLRDENVGISGPAAGLNAGIYPNPVSGLFTLNFVSAGQDHRTTIELYSLDGKKIGELFQGNFLPGTQKLQLNAGNIAPGIYLLVLKSGSSMSALRFIRN